MSLTDNYFPYHGEIQYPSSVDIAFQLAIDLT